MNNIYLAILSIVAWGVGSIFYKMANDQLHPMMVSAITTSAYLVLVPLSFFFIKFDHQTTTSGVAFAVVGACCMAAGSLAYFFALKAGEAGLTTALTSVYPALTLLLSMLFFGEHLTVKKVIGISLALASVLVLSRK